MPDVKVEIAFGSGYATPAADRAWTDVSSWVELAEGLSIDFGRGDERSTADANTLSLTLDNTDGRFTALRPASPYYPNVRIGTPIRVTATPVGGSPSVRFVGFVDEWPVSWDGSDDYADAQITASSRLARLGLDATLRSVIEQTILAGDPVAYYTLSEAEGATSAADSSGNGAAPLTMRGDGAAVVFGVATGPGGDDRTAATFAGGQYLEGDARSGGSASESSVIFFNRSTPPATIENLFLGGPMTTLRMDSAGHIFTTGVTSSRNYADGATHCAAAVYEVPEFGPPTFYLYVDGVLVGSTNGGGGGSLQLRVGGPDSGGGAFTGVLAHAATFDNPLSAAHVADIATAGRGAFAGETAGARLIRYAGWAGIDPSEVAAAGATTLSAIDTTDSQIVDVMRAVETTEGGVLFDARDGVLTLLDRAVRYTGTGFTLDMAAQTIGADFAPKLDRSALVNDATGTNTAGTITARVVDTASRDYYGPATASIEVATDDPDAPRQAAEWTVARYAEPKVRVPSLTVNLLDFTAAPSQNDVLGATIGTLLTVTNQPGQAATATGAYFVEGCTEAIGPEAYTMTFNVSPAEPYNQVVIFDAPGRGFDHGVFAY